MLILKKLQALNLTNRHSSKYGSDHVNVESFKSWKIEKPYNYFF